MSGNEQMGLERHGFVAAVEAAMRGRCGVEKGWRLLAAVSGGADSVALLLALSVLARRGHWELDVQVGHVNHHLRDEADGDAKFVRELAGRLGLEFAERDIRPGELEGNLEGNARRMRYEALGEIAGKIDADAVVTGHHADDQLETMLMRLVRGSSVNGMGLIAARRRLPFGDAAGQRDGVLVIRPMLGVDHGMAEGFCRDAGVEWREDLTNRSVERWRSRLRVEVLPVLRGLRADAGMKADETAEQLRGAAEVVERRVKVLIKKRVVEISAKEVVMERETARRISRGLLGACLRRLAVRMGVSGDQLAGRVVGQIVTAARDKSGEARRFDLAGGVRVEVDSEGVRVCGPG